MDIRTGLRQRVLDVTIRRHFTDRFTKSTPTAMRFGIRDLLYATSVIAGVLALARDYYVVFYVLAFVVCVCLVVCPLAILFTTIVFADQRGQTLDLDSNPLYAGLMKLWLITFCCVIVISIVLKLVPGLL